MGFRNSLATSLLNNARKIGEGMGCNMTVEVSNSKLKTTMEVPDTNKRGWDSSMYDNAGLFIDGYANPVKPVARETSDPKQPDQPDVEVGDATDDTVTFDLIPSYRYRQHQDQHVLSELVNPTEQWKLIVYGIIGLGVLIFVNIIIVMYAGGGF